MRDIKDKDKTLTVNQAETTSAHSARGVAPVTHRTRSSFWATISLVLGLAGALTVLTGVLAGPAIALGVLAAFAGVAGMAATTRRHVAGRADALLGMFFATAAIVLGILALTGALPWFGEEASPIASVAEWLAARVPWMFPS